MPKKQEWLHCEGARSVMSGMYLSISPVVLFISQSFPVAWCERRRGLGVVASCCTRRLTFVGCFAGASEVTSMKRCLAVYSSPVSNQWGQVQFNRLQPPHLPTLPSRQQFNTRWIRALTDGPPLRVCVY